MRDLQRPPVELLSVEFGDMGISVTFADPQRSSTVVAEIRTLQLNGNHFQDRIFELMDDLFDLIDAAEQEAAGAAPMTRPPRRQPGDDAPSPG